MSKEKETEEKLKNYIWDTERDMLQAIKLENRISKLSKQQATTQTLTQVQEIIDKIENKVNTAKFSFPVPTEEEEQRYKDLQISILDYLKQELKSQISKLNHSQQEQMGDKGYTMSSPSSVAKKSDYTGMSESNQKHTPADIDNNKEVKERTQHPNEYLR